MGLQGLHKFANSNNVYKENTPLCSALQEHKTDILFIDFCGIFFSLLQRFPGADVIQKALINKLQDQQDDPVFLKAIDQFMDRVLKQVQRIRSIANENLDVCFVIDGYTLPAKEDTHKKRKNNKREMNTFSWKVRVAILNNLQARNNVFPYYERVKQYATTRKNKKSTKSKKQQEKSDKKKSGNTYYQYSRFEADSEIVYLCQNIPVHQRGAIASEDGDLFAYPGAFDALRIMKITWNNLTATTTTKMELFKGFGFSTSKKSRRLNETKMAILATLCGNDYAPKYPNLPIARLVHILKHMKSPAKEDLYADLFMEQVIEKINKDSTIAKPKNKKNINTQRFNIALHQFCMPQVTGVTLEDNEKLCCYYDALPINKNESILHQLGNEFDLLPWSKNDHSLIENTPTLRKRQQELLLLQQQQKNTISNDTLSSIQQQSATTSIQPLVQITFNKSSIMSLLASSKAHIFTLSALVICYFPLLFFLFYIYMVIIIFLCMSFILSSSTTNPTSSSSKKIHSK